MTFNRKEADELQAALNTVTEAELKSVLHGLSQRGTKKPGAGGKGIKRPGAGCPGQKRPAEVSAKISATLTGKPLSEAHKLSIATTLTGHPGAGPPKIPCTIDDWVTTYPSVRALIKALGRGKAGRGHPNFKTLDM